MFYHQFYLHEFALPCIYQGLIHIILRVRNIWSLAAYKVSIILVEILSSKYMQNKSRQENNDRSDFLFTAIYSYKFYNITGETKSHVIKTCSYYLRVGYILFKKIFFAENMDYQQIVSKIHHLWKWSDTYTRVPGVAVRVIFRHLFLCPRPIYKKN